MNEFDIEQYCEDHDLDESEECDMSIFLSNYKKFFEKLDTPPFCNTDVYVEKAYRFTSQRFFIVNNSLYRIVSKECDVWDLNLTSYPEMLSIDQLMEEQVHKDKSKCSSVVCKKVRINNTDCTVMSSNYSDENDREFVDDIFNRKEEILQFI